MKKEILILACGGLMVGCQSHDSAYNSGVSREYGFTFDHIAPYPVQVDAALASTSIAFSEPVVAQTRTAPVLSPKTDVLEQRPEELRDTVIVSPLGNSPAVNVSTAPVITEGAGARPAVDATTTTTTTTTVTTSEPNVNIAAPTVTITETNAVVSPPANVPAVPEVSPTAPVEK